MAVGIIAWAIIETWPWLLLAWAVVLLIAGGVLGLAAVLDDWMNGVPPDGRLEPTRYPDADWRIVGGAERETEFVVGRA